MRRRNHRNLWSMQLLADCRRISRRKSVAMQYNTIQYNTIQYNTIQYNTIQYNTIQYNTIISPRRITISCRLLAKDSLYILSIRFIFIWMIIRIEEKMQQTCAYFVLRTSYFVLRTSREQKNSKNKLTRTHSELDIFYVKYFYAIYTIQF